MFGWVIDKDHLAEEMPIEGLPDRSGNEYGEIPPAGVKRESVRFTLWDDDNVRYYSGRFFTDNRDGITEEETYDVLAWAMKDAGAVSMRFPGHPEYDLG